MALVDIIDSVTPGWAKTRPHWWGAFRLGAALVDGILAALFQGRRASMPNAIDVPGIPGYGGFESVESLYKIAPDLGVIPGLTESPPDLAYRLRHAHDPAAGGWEAPPILGMFEQLAGVLGPTPPLMRAIYLDSSDWWTRYQDGHYELIRANGTGYTYNLDGTTSANTTHAQAVDWDSQTLPAPPDKGYVGRWILILYMPVNTPYGTTGPYTFNSGAVFGHLWNDLHNVEPADPWPDVATFGTNSPAKLVDLVLGVVKQREAAGFRCVWVVIATDPASFNPDGSSTLPAGALGSAYPNGTWGWDGRLSGGQWVTARNSTAIYWRMPDD